MKYILTLTLLTCCFIPIKSGDNDLPNGSARCRYTIHNTAENLLTILIMNAHGYEYNPEEGVVQKLTNKIKENAIEEETIGHRYIQVVTKDSSHEMLLFYNGIITNKFSELASGEYDYRYENGIGRLSASPLTGD